MEWSLPRNNLNKENTKAPHIDLKRVWYTLQYLGGDVGWGAAVRFRSEAVYSIEHFGKAKIDQLDMSAVLHREHYVLRFQVPVYDVLLRKILQSEQDLLGVKDELTLQRLVLVRLFVVVLAAAANLRQQGAPLDVLQLEVEVVVVLERTDEVHDEGTYVLSKLLKLLIMLVYHG